MPLVAIHLLEGRSADEVDTISDVVHQAMVELLDVPQRDRFQIITQHSPGSLRFDRHYLEVDRGDGFVLVHITLSAGRTTDAKRRFY
jgi:4-oxalocrotonate tautomerase